MMTVLRPIWSLTRPQPYDVRSAPKGAAPARKPAISPTLACGEKRYRMRQPFAEASRDL